MQGQKPSPTTKATTPSIQRHADRSSHKATFTDRYRKEKEKQQKTRLNEGSLASDVVSLDPCRKSELETYLRDRHDKLVTHITDDLMLLDPYPTQSQKVW